jgi:hypothetical protein
LCAAGCWTHPRALQAGMDCHVSMVLQRLALRGSCRPPLHFAHTNHSGKHAADSSSACLHSPAVLWK